MFELGKLIKNVFIYGSGVWAGKLIGFIMIPVYTRALTPADYGVLELISRTTDVVMMLFGLGLASALFRFHAEGKSEKEKDRIINTAVVFSASVGFVMAMILIALAGQISALVFNSTSYTPYLRVALISTGCELCAIVPLATLRIHQKSSLFTAANLGRLVLALCLNIYLVVMLHLGVWGILISSLVSISSLLLFVIAITRRYWKPHIDTIILGRMLAYSLPLVPSSLAMFVLNFGDRYFLRSYDNLSVLGVYSLGYKLCLTMPALIMEPLGLAWTAVMFTIAAREDADSVYRRYFNGNMFCVVFFSLILASLSRDLVSIMSVAEYRDAWKVVPILLLGFFGWASAGVFGTGVLLEKKSYYLTLSNTSAAIVALVSYALLIPRYGAIGAAVATVCSFATMSISMYVIANRVHPISYDIRRFAHLVVMSILMYAITLIVPGEGTVPSIIYRLLIVLMFPIALYTTGFFDQEDITAAKCVVKGALNKIGLASQST